MSAFEEWYNGMVGFHINSEHMLDDLSSLDGNVSSVTLRKWMVVCWNQALEAAQNSLLYEEYFFENGFPGDDAYSFCSPYQEIEAVKEKP
jgi:hypothetical protein